MGNPQVNNNQNYTFSVPAFKPKAQEPKQQKITIPLLPEGETPYKSPMIKVAGATVDKNLIDKVRQEDGRTEIKLKNGLEIDSYPNCINPTVIHKAQNGSIVINDADNLHLFNNGHDNVTLNNANETSYCSFAGGDTLRVSNSRNMDIFGAESGKPLVLQDTSNKPSSGPSLSDSRVNGFVKNELFWTKNIESRND